MAIKYYIEAHNNCDRETTVAAMTDKCILNKDSEDWAEHRYVDMTWRLYNKMPRKNLRSYQMLNPLKLLIIFFIFLRIFQLPPTRSSWIWI